MVETRRQGSKPNAQARVCPHFLRNKCRYGQNCRLRHDTPSNKSSAPTNHSDTPKPPRDGKLHQWKRLIKLGDMGYNSPELTKAAVGQFFQLGLELLDGDIGAAQDAIKLLAKDSGLAFIKAVVELHIPHTHTLANFTLWESEVKPMFSLITHPRVVDSAVLEQQVADLFNFLLGVQGRRMTKLFNFILQLLVNSLLPAEADSRGNILELSLNVLSKIIDCNTNNIVNPECGRLVSAFVQLMHQHPGSQDDFSFLQASKYIEYMQQRLDTGKDIPDLVYNQTIPVSRQEFVLKRNGPGTLSAEGRRHDNDHANINKIKIMPTYDEIVSPRAEYLPTKYPSQWHIDGIRGRLDREFRLIREDTVGQLRDVVRDMLEAARDPRKGAPQKSKTMRTFNYEDPVTINVDWHRIGGLEMVVRCNQLPVVNKLNAMKRREWWGQSKRLQSGALVCLFDITGTVLFCVVSDTTMRSKDDKDARKMDTKDKEKNQGSDKEVRTLSDDKAVLFVNLKLVDPTTREISQAMRWFKNTRSSPRRYLVEFPGVLLDSFKHTLLALQKMHEKPNVPFKNLLAPSKDSDSDTDVGLPHYARRPGFTFDLSCLSTDNSTLIMDPHSPITPETLALKTSLDPTQSAALLNTLTRELSLVQGPPGTGKSYTGEKIIKVLLNARNKAKLGPILCVCYTNHALDQLLEHLLDDGIKSIIRMGSRSKSERLENLNLRTIAKEAFLTKSEKSGLWEAERGIREDVDEGQKLLQELAFCQSWASVKALMSSEYPRQHMEMFGDDRDGWKTVIHQPEMVIHRWLQGGINTGANPRQLEQLKHVPLQSLSKDERTILHRHWVKSIRDPIITKLARLNKQYNDDVTRKDEIRGDIDLRCLNEANIVGVTTTGLARNLNLLRKLRCKVLLCEEAGEVLEAHNLTALLPSIEHTILIGDHLQLRPQIQNYDLQSTNPRGKQFSLDVSLFERLVEPSHDTAVKIPYSVLETQRRMHPSIAELVRSTLYPSLKDSENVEEYPQVVGMRRRLFWFDHDHPETANDNNESTSTSKSNNFEVDMTASLVSHLSQQGKYGAGDIAVLTPYLGQLQLLRRRMESMFEICVNDRDADDLEAIEEEGTDTKTPNAGTLRKTTLLKTVRVATVDNFQGEEAKIIVISLVRSNPQQECGFLKTSNRINVLLSRAQHGMYIIGNQNSYERVPMWAGVIKILAAAALKLVMAMHLASRARNDVKHVALTRDATRLACTAPCAAPCNWVPCSLRCDKLLDCGHQCPSLCGEVCPTSALCQVCATDEIKSVCVDFIMMAEYRDIDLNEEPCIFPSCGHFLTVSSMDGQMGMAAHYTLDANGLPTQILRASEPFSLDGQGIKSCPTCRGSLRSVSRYGRIVRRAMLDEATKKFISWSNDEYHLVASRLVTEQECLAALEPPVILDRNAGAAAHLTVAGSRQRQLQLLKEFVGTRYGSILQCRKTVVSYATKVKKEEQPFQRVANLVKHSNLHRGGQSEFQYDQAVIQSKGGLLASALLLKCDILILSDLFGLLLGGKARFSASDVNIDFSRFMIDCDALIKDAKTALYPREEAQGHLFYAQLCVLSRQCASAKAKLTQTNATTSVSESTAVSESLEQLHDTGLGHIFEARRLLEENPSILVLKNELDAAEEALNGGVYRPVTAEELRQVYAASKGELRGTGHWYTCRNGHPFTINNCGMAMEQATCPECRAPIGGQNHRSVEGVRHATEIEQMAEGLRGMRL
ncbi:hypothetical protein FGRA07_00567 [Fusarium graminearum]|nr:hypothetical protein FGRA07_00567 [Fusarium graminearum]